MPAAVLDMDHRDPRSLSYVGCIDLDYLVQQARQESQLHSLHPLDEEQGSPQLNWLGAQLVEPELQNG